MTRRDERGVVVAAPLQGGSDALAGPKYGDKYRGPAVADAYELSRCWIDLAEHSHEWPSPDNFPPRMVEFAQAIPEDQRNDWLRRQGNLEEVERLISYALRCGDLPIWVAPIGEPDRLIAPDALATIDSRSIKSGIFFPTSEDYKSEGDRPWLWERPLFVKWNDWVRFVATVQTEKRAVPEKIKGGENGLPGGAKDQDSGDNSWIKNLPPGWIDGHAAFGRLRTLLIDGLQENDPAPWHMPVNADYWGPHWGMTPEDYILNEKRIERLLAAFQRAFALGSLTASSFNGTAFRELPSGAFLNRASLRNAMFIGPLDLDPLWPDDWQQWSGHGWAIPKADFERWSASRDALRLDGLPFAGVNAMSCPAQIQRRFPTAGSRVALSEAVTWVAFGLALNAERLDRAISWERLSDGDLDSAQRLMEDAARALLDAGAGSQVSFYGRHVAAHGEKGQTTKKIEPLDLEDFRQILIQGHDQLYYGTGLKCWHSAPNHSHVRSSERGDLFSSVKVDRAALMACFPPAFDVPEDHMELNSPIGWDTFGPQSLVKLERHEQLASRDEWWSWPEAIAWVGTKDTRNIATMRHWGEEWKGDGDASIIIGAQYYIARQFLHFSDEPERDLHNAVERGAIGTSGRSTRDGISTLLTKEDWRGGEVVYSHGTAQLVSAANNLAEWFFDVAVKRSDLLREFPPSEAPIPPATDCPPTVSAQMAAVDRPRERRGRTKGAGSFELADAPLLIEMRDLISSQKAFAPDGAAKLVAHKAKGGGTESSRASRLAKRYRDSEKNKAL